MGQHVARLSSVVRLVGVVGLAGCSLLYNPDKLPAAPIDADSDAEVILDADPAQLELVSVSPAVVFEGTGTGGGRAAVLTIIGTQMVPGATVMITPHGAGAPMITVENAQADVAADGRMIAVPITLPVDLGLGATTRLRLDVTVTQPAGGSTVSRTLSQLDATNDTPVLELQGLDELTDANPVLASGVHEYSQVQVSGSLAASDTDGPLILRVTGSISIGGTTQVNANKDVPGPGGNAGGAGGEVLAGGLAGPGSPGGGAGGGKTAGGGGGFALMGGGTSGGDPVGDPQISSHAAPNRGNGGAGGNSGTLTAGGKGGGGGGTIELTAGGSITVGQVEAKGGLGSTGANTGGGGSGGVVLLRSAVAITAAGVNVAGGTGGNTGSVGRIRLDVPAATPTTVPAAYRGPMFAADTVVITRDEQPSLTVFGEDGGTFAYRFSNDANMVRGPFSQGIAGGATTFPLAEPLFRGLNTICLQVEGGGSTPEARNCIQIVYLFKP